MAQTTKAPSSLPAPPRILGIVTADILAARRWPDALWTCGGVELRADGLPPESIAAAVADFDEEKSRRGFSGPVVFTLRLTRDGGAWPDAAAADRNAVWQSLPPGTCDWVDLEIEEIETPARIAPETLDALQSSGVKILLSHHAFVPEDPAAWDRILSDMRGYKPDGVKFAVSVTSDQVPALLAFARRVGGEYPESGVLGMGAAGMSTRLVNPLLGCPFTYGYIGAAPVAPGQLRVDDMKAFFARAAVDPQRPDKDASVEAWREWADALLKRVTGA